MTDLLTSRIKGCKRVMVMIVDLVDLYNEVCMIPQFEGYTKVGYTNG